MPETTIRNGALRWNLKTGEDLSNSSLCPMVKLILIMLKTFNNLFLEGGKMVAEQRLTNHQCENSCSKLQCTESPREHGTKLITCTQISSMSAKIMYSGGWHTRTNLSPLKRVTNS